MTVHAGRLAIVIPMVAAAAAASPAAAQWRSLPPDGASVSRQDVEHQQGAARVLLDAEPPRIGASQAWSNPDSGAQGSVTLLGLSTFRGLPCRRLRYDTTTRGMARPVTVTFTLCRTEDGSWKIAE